MFDLSELVISNAQFVISKGELSFKEVLDSFSESKYIYILTYNLGVSMKDDLLSELNQRVKKDCNVTIITNIPVNYYTENNKRFENYKQLLNPERYSFSLYPYFNFSNHSKIIITDKKAYIGSSNFTKKSSENIESGIIISDTQSIQELIKYVKAVAKQSISYYENENIYKALISESSMIEQINNIKEESFLINNSIISEKIQDAILGIIEKADEVIRSAGNIYGVDFLSMKSEELIDKIGYMDYKVVDDVLSTKTQIKSIMESRDNAEMIKLLISVLNSLKIEVQRLVDYIVPNIIDTACDYAKVEYEKRTKKHNFSYEDSKSQA